MLGSFIINRLPLHLTAVFTMLLLLFTGCIEGSDLLSVFGSSTVLTMASMLVLSSALSRTRLTDYIASAVKKRAGGSFYGILAFYVLFTFVLGQFMSSTTALYLCMLPIVSGTCERLNISPSKMLYSIGLVAVTCSFSIMPIGPYAAGFIEDNGYLASYGWSATSFTIWDQSIVKLPCSILILLYAIFIVPRLVKDVPPLQPSADSKQKAAALEQQLPLWIDISLYCIFAVVIVSLMLGGFGMPLYAVPMAGAAMAAILCSKSKPLGADSVGIEIILLYVGVSLMGTAFGNTGAGELVGELAGKLLVGIDNPYIVGIIFYCFAFIMTTFLYNRAVSKIPIPLALVTCIGAGLDPRGPMILCYIGSMASLLTPMSTSVVPMLIKTGGYSQKDLLRLGLPPAIITGIVAVAVCMTVFPL